MIRLITLCLTIIFSQLAHATLEASVDRTRLVEGEALELTLETPSASRLSELDLSPLQEHFEVQRTRQLSLVSQIDGKTTPVTRWVVRLLPQRTGFVVIPPLNLGTSASQPISLQVLSAAQAANDSRTQLAPVFIDSEVDIETPYVQAQVLLTLRIYHSVSLFDDSVLSGLDIPHARVESLGPPRHFERLMNGVRHGVIEMRYAIFAQQSGELEIPSQLFSATTLQPTDGTQRFSARTGKLIQVRSPSITLQVKPVPDSYPAGVPWIPTSALSLSQTWQPDPGIDLLSGEPLTRTLILEADGLNASQLPVLQSLPGDADSELRQYADQPRLESRINDSGIHSARHDSAALVALQEGSYSLPQVVVHWWNTAEDQLEVSTLDAVTLNFSRSGDYPEVSEPLNFQTSEPTLLWPWQLATALLLSALAASLYYLRLAHHILAEYSLPEAEEDLDDATQDNPLADLQAACRTNQPAEARKALETWARQQHTEGLIGLAHNYLELEEALDDLNACLFGRAHHTWRGKPLWRAVRMVIQSRRREAEEQQTAKPEGLYPEV
ncbi:Oxygen tolerance [Halopseudomonas litoralis]|uniref:Oxygen tolerance n=1 Tax=Halopseudomonas litoralis TaxID=797277 RepID=A0A1H1PCZ4_9GAMM|nr:BatD family protein [Halopseudomonas litoralis]SDS08970.1 Oxygen tolerance [Halopseudomonas litoralis]